MYWVLLKTNLNMTDLQQYFDRIQPRYYINEIASLGFTGLFRRKAVRKVKSYSNKRVLDLMSGQGENLRYIQKSNSHTKIVTLDFSSAMNRKLLLDFKEKYSLQQIEGDFFQNGIPDHSMDIILCSYGAKTIENGKEQLFADELSRIIDENGEIILVEFVKPRTPWRFSCVKCYIEIFVSKIFGREFKELFHYINKYESLQNLKNHLVNNNLSVLTHKRYLDLVEILHVKKM
jgi:ubiquinone/menaquinone biosynthesis C-methylase UbiE